MSNLDIGIVYVATGEKYAREAVSSVQLLRSHMPDIPTCIFTDVPSDCKAHFTFVKEITPGERATGNKIAPLRETPFERTIFLDTDIWIQEDISSLFCALDRYHLAAAHAMTRDRPDYPTDCPDWFPELNSGFIAYRKCDEVLTLFRRWEEIYSEFKAYKDGGKVLDQPSLRKALFLSDLNIWVLPPEYNFRTHVPNFSAAGARVKVIHGRQNLSRLALILNGGVLDRRIYTPNLFRRSAHCLRVLSERDELLWRMARTVSNTRLYRWFARVVLSKRLPFRRFLFEKPVSK